MAKNDGPGESSRRLRLVDPAEAPVTLIDSNVILDLTADDQQWKAWSDAAVAEALDAGRAVINPLVYAEVSMDFDTAEECDAALVDFERERLPYEAGFLAGRAFLAYRKRGGVRRSRIADFYIGAHAAVKSYRLLTRDAARYRTYFPKLQLITP